MNKNFELKRETSQLKGQIQTAKCEIKFNINF